MIGTDDNNFTPLLIFRRFSIIAQGIIDGIPGQPFFIMVEILSVNSIHLPKHMYVALVVYLPSITLKLPPTSAEDDL